MKSDAVIWPDDAAPPAIESWVTGLFSTADSKGDEAAKTFSEFFQDDATMMGLTDPIHGRQGSTV